MPNAPLAASSSRGSSPQPQQRRTHDHSVWSVQRQEMRHASLMAPGSSRSSMPTFRVSLTSPLSGSLGSRSGSSQEVEEFTVDGAISSSRDTPRRAGSARLVTSKEEDGFVVCPESLRTIDAKLTKSNGSPTILFRICQFFCAIQFPHILAGTFCSPGVMSAIREGDKLMALAIVGVAAMVGGSVFILEETRRAIRPHGPLATLGAGSKEIPQQLYANIERTVEKFHPSRRPFKFKVFFFAALFGIVIYFADELVQSPVHNIVSAILWFFFYLFGNTIIAIWIISMKMATILSGHAVREVINTIDLTNDMNEWNTKVCAPAMELAAQTMPALSVGWGFSVVVYTGCAMIGVVSFFALALSPELLTADDHPWFPMAVQTGCGVVIMICTAFPLLVASGPAHVSSQCDELMEALNELRIALMSTEADAQITFLEKSLLQLNQRQGLGFLVARTVIDKGKIQRTAKTVAGLVITLGPVLLAWSTTENADSCALTEPQRETIKHILESFGLDETCGTNITVSIGADGELIVV